MRNHIVEKYFEWLYKLVSSNRYREPLTYRKLLLKLYHTEFTWTIDKDRNRADDGIALRYDYFAREFNIDDSTIDDNLNFPCSVLEMMVALAIRCEQTIMDNPDFGNRTGQWFWDMISNLGLGGMFDDIFDPVYVKEVIDTFLQRQYSSDGVGGLFRINDRSEDLRDVEIWCQLCWYLDKLC